ncbi:MAG: 4-(cytidine 5'-diphospho)-2-C-methyl-D-erythritol kinase [Bacteroidales bacterium]|nr:4-(cytidine 5'-diphospho)-2-C-methyl-D-erythritol kinase [Bacteroidales bacterium]
MIRFPNCKINIGLSILEKLPDGYHRIESLMFPIPLRDILEIVPTSSGETKLTVTGNVPQGEMQQNLCYRAWKLMHESYGIPAVEMHLHKLIPHGAGLGGGSSDAAFTLQMLNEIFNLNLSLIDLKSLAFKLGMDCPFFLLNSPAIATHKGEILNPVQFSLSGYQLYLVKPSEGVSTAEAYAGVKPRFPEISLDALMNSPITKWKEKVKNDFEESVFKAHPKIEEIKNELYRQGAIYASMSGSGSAVYGIFNADATPEINMPGLFTWKSLL